MRVYKYIVIGLLLFSTAFGLTISMPGNLTISEGESKDIQINLTNNHYQTETVGIVGYADNSSLMIVPPSRTITMDTIYYYYTSTNTTFTVNAQNAKAGDYIVTFLFSSIIDKTVYSRTMSVRVEQTLEVTPAYSYVKVTQGDFVTLKFTIANTGKSGRNMIVDPESFPDEFNAEYPDPFYLESGASKTVSIKLTIPGDYHSGVYSEKIIVLSGEVRAESSAFDLSIAKRSEFRNVVNIDAIELGGFIGENGEKGYNLMVRVDNRKDEPINGVEVTGFPLGWNVTGDTPFDIGANSVRDITVKIIPTDLDEHKIDVLLAKDTLVLTNATLTFSGAKAGLTGAFLFGGSLTIGLLIVVILVLVLLYIRQKNIQADEADKMDKVGYLKELVDEAKKKR